MNRNDPIVIQARLQEFAALREEILFALRSRVWGVATYAIFVGGLLTFAVKTQTSIAYIGPIILAIPFVWYTCYVERQRVRISAYIATIIEPNVPGLGFERVLESWRQNVHEESGWRRAFSRIRYILSLVGAPDTVALFCVCHILLAKTPVWQDIVAIVGFAVLLQGHVSLNDVLSRGKHEEYCRKFQSFSLGNDSPKKEEAPA